MDKIKAYYQADDTLSSVIRNNEKTIMSEVLALEINQGPGPEGAYTREWDLNGEKAVLGVIR
jgi:isoleucyl-tRNA synthetase